MATTINSLTVQQGTGFYVRRSVVECIVDFENTLTGNPADLIFQLSTDNGATYDDVVMYAHGTYNGRNKLSGNLHVSLIDVRNTIEQGIVADYDGANAKVRVKAVDAVNGFDSGWTESDAFDLQTYVPTVTSTPTVNDYVQPDMSISVTAQKRGGADPIFIKVGLDLAEMALDPTVVPDGYETTYGYTVPGQTPDGYMDLYLRVYDEFYNASEIATVGAASDPAGTRPWMQRTPPSGARVNIIGTVGHGDYTGIVIEEDGSFTPSREVMLQMIAQSPIPMTYHILADSDIERYYHVDGGGGYPGSLRHPVGGATITNNLYSVDDDEVFDLTASNAQPVVKLTTNREAPDNDDFNRDTDALVYVAFEDAAGNQTPVSAAIRLNTRVYKTSSKPLREPDATYAPILREANDNGNDTVLVESILLSEEPLRAWPDVFHPATHSYPVDEFGDFDEAAAIALGEQSSEDFDAVSLDAGAVVYDAEQRVVMADWTSDGSKNYAAMTSSTIGSLTGWVIDNTGRGDFSLTFEHFDLDERIYGPPFNRLAPHPGDVLVVYDATADGATKTVFDNVGRPSLAIDDTTKLKELFAFTGGGTSVVDLLTGRRVGSDANGGFTTDSIVNLNRVALVLYTDPSADGAGFRLKASEAIDNRYLNFHLDELNGEVWVHKHVNLGTAMGAADTTVKTLTYDHVDGYVHMDYESPAVRFDTKPSGQVTVDWAYYLNDTPSVNTFVASHDDLIDYGQAPIYVTAAGAAIADTDRAHLQDVDGDGRLQAGATWDKDRGLVTVTDVSWLTSRRLFADYDHHTFVRLSDDGYGDLVFNDPVLVADDTPAFPDYTWADVRISNEGTSDLEDGKIVFTARGYDTDNDGEVVLDPSDAGDDDIVDQVLDIHRPWDVQKGTKEETFKRAAMAWNNNYVWDPRSCPKSGGNAAPDNAQAGNAGATTILSYWQDRSFGNLSARSVGYGRVVYVLGGSSGSQYPPTTEGEKRFSMEASGKFYQTTIGG